MYAVDDLRSFHAPTRSPDGGPVTRYRGKRPGAPFQGPVPGPFPPVTVNSGPVKANVLRDNQIDLGQFPAPRWYGADGGRVLIDATRNWTFEPNPDWDGRRMSPIASMDPDLERKIASRWKEYGIGSDYLDDDMRERLTLEQLRKRFPDV